MNENLANFIEYHEEIGQENIQSCGYTVTRRNEYTYWYLCNTEAANDFAKKYNDLRVRKINKGLTQTRLEVVLKSVDLSRH